MVDKVPLKVVFRVGLNSWLALRDRESCGIAEALRAARGGEGSRGGGTPVVVAKEDSELLGTDAATPLFWPPSPDMSLCRLFLNSALLYSHPCSHRDNLVGKAWYQVRFGGDRSAAEAVGGQMWVVESMTTGWSQPHCLRHNGTKSRRERIQVG